MRLFLLVENASTGCSNILFWSAFGKIMAKSLDKAALFFYKRA
jgi:hypothetical protein